MEVHHYSHALGKKWTHYFWEFLMLFLAAFTTTAKLTGNLENA